MIYSHQWLEIQESGDRIRLDRATKYEDRELLQALRLEPVRVVDLFRRMRVSDSHVFQEMLGRMVSRGWVKVHEANPTENLGDSQPALPASLGAPKEDPPGGSGDQGSALDALLARYARSASEGTEVPWEASQEGMPSEEDLLIALRGTTDFQPAEPRQEPHQEKPPIATHTSVSVTGETVESLVLPDPVELPSPFLSESVTEKEVPLPPWEAIPPSPPVNEEEESALMAAMGLSGKKTGHQAPPRRPVAAAPPSERWGGGGHEALLAALRQEKPSGLENPPVEVPSYGLGLSASPPPADSQHSDFVRLRDVGAVHGPGDGASGAPTTPSDLPQPLPVKASRKEPEEMTARSRRRHEDRSKMLDAARREAAARQEAKDRAAQRLRERDAAAAVQREKVMLQRAQEDMGRGGTFMDRAERARRIREGLPLDEKKNGK